MPHRFVQLPYTARGDDLRVEIFKVWLAELIPHGDDDQIVPIAASALLSSKLIRNATLKVYEGAPHGMRTTHKDRVSADLLDFIK